MAKFIEQTNDDLVLRARTQANALGQLYEIYYDRILRFCVHRLFNKEIAEDITSTVFLEVAQQIMNQAIVLMRGQEYGVTSNQVLELVHISTCSAYDCEFVALARDLKVPLVTVDRQILKEFPDTGISLESYVGAR